MFCLHCCEYKLSLHLLTRHLFAWPGASILGVGVATTQILGKGSWVVAEVRRVSQGSRGVVDGS